MSQIGARYGDGFQLLRELARGTRAQVFLASDGRSVEAVKVHRPSNADRADLEYRVGRTLDHPNLVTIRERFDLDGAPAVAMPLVPGPRLSSWARGAERDARLDALDRLLAGLGAFHAAGFVHRDVKPENVVYAGERRPVLLDYDLAVERFQRPEVPWSAGTPAYLSPEQASGGSVGAASDLYAVGVILFHWLTGELPFEGSAEEIVAAHREGEVPLPSRVEPGLRAFDPIVAGLLAKRPEERFDRAETVRAALRAARGDAPFG